jgi:hypothetical protein
MTVATDWSTKAFFEDAEPESLDGGKTDRGALWHAISPRWGHSMHAMCSYHGMFPPRLAHYFIQRYSLPDELVLDPFSGRGTTTLQARVEDRRTISNDLSPLGYALTAAKSSPPSWETMEQYVTELEDFYKQQKSQISNVSEDIRMLFDDETLRQLVFLRSRLLREAITSWSPRDVMLAGVVAGILHGARRSDGSSMYLSISMPNTFSMPPEYVRRFIRENGLTKPEQNVFDCVREKLARIYLDSVEGSPGETHKVDASRLLAPGGGLKASNVDLVITSPPYLRVVNYGTSNWIRLWWLGIDNVSTHGGAGRKVLDAELDHRHTYETYKDFMLRIFTGIRRILKRDGVAVVVIGDVARPGHESVNLGGQLWSDVGERTGLRLVDQIEDSLPADGKVSRIWGDTKGKATDQECVLVLGREDGEIRDPREVGWDEPYRDGGPDKAHARARRRRGDPS